MGGRRTSSEKKMSSTGTKDERFHVTHKLPPGDSPYARAKHDQLVEKDPEGEVVLFRKAINGRDRVESAVKDIASVLKQLDRSEEAIEALKTYTCQTHHTDKRMHMRSTTMRWAEGCSLGFHASRHADDCPMGFH